MGITGLSKRSQDEIDNSNAGNIARRFITTWKTTRNNEEINIPTNRYNSSYNYTVDWGDGIVNTRLTGDATHRYASAGIYQVEITGDQRLVEWTFHTKAWTIFPPFREFKSSSYSLNYVIKHIALVWPLPLMFHLKMLSDKQRGFYRIGS